MPFSGGSAGAHDDSMHQGNAKRDVADGLAGLGPLGELLAPGPDLVLTRNGSENIEVVERTSGNIVFRWTRIGANDFECRVNCGGVACIIQNDGMKDVANGIAALDGGGSLIVPGSLISITRSVADNVDLYERTSGELLLRFLRDSANNYRLFANSGGVSSQVQLSAYKDVVNGIAGLDAMLMQVGSFPYPVIEEYSNHLGATDNFTQTGTSGNGAASTDAANHTMDLSCGLTVIGHGRFESKKTWTLGSKPIIANFLISSVVDGAGGSRRSRFGLKADFSGFGDSNAVEFYHNDSDNWAARTFGTSLGNSQTISDIVAGDLCTIVATSSSCKFFVNGVLVHTSTIYIPTTALHVGGQAISYTSAAATARELGIDMMSVKRYA